MFALRSIGNTKQDGCTTGYLSKCKMTGQRIFPVGNTIC